MQCCKSLLKDKTKLQDQSPIAGSTKDHPLYLHVLCTCRGCDTACHTRNQFSQHLTRWINDYLRSYNCSLLIFSCHILGDKSTAQIVEQQLNKEQHRLVAMMDHLKQIQEEERLDQLSTQLSPQLPQLSPFPSCPILHHRE